LLQARDEARAEVKSERNTAELREQFIAVLGHDLRNPLAAVASGIHLLDKEDLSERGRRIVGLMEGSVTRAGGLIDNVLDFARGRLGDGIILSRDAKEPLQPVLHQVVAEIRSIDPERIVTARYDLDEPIDCDRARIGQLLSNLLGNALTHGAKDKPIAVSASTTDRILTISVVNGGDAISPETMEKLFQPFFRGSVRPSREGLGLGLHIASEIAKAHQGELCVASDAAHTSFTFTMPLAQTDR
jgi:sigma-B regulation protein RsbU (phosphoserine phosphatase)